MTLPPRMSLNTICALLLAAVVAAPVGALATDDQTKPAATPASEPAEKVPAEVTAGDKAAAEKTAEDAKKTDEDAAKEDEEEKEEASSEPGSEETGEDKPLNIAAIGSIATGTTGVLSGLMVVVVAVLQVPNPFLYPFYQSDLADAEARYRETRDYDQLRRAQEAQAGIDAVETGFSNQAGVLLTSVAALLPAVVTLAVGITQLVVEE